MNGNSPPARASRHRGHMLLLAIVLATLMSVFLALAMQPIRTTSQRWRERELVYRGEHLAQGIRQFFLRNRRFPFSLEELLRQDPRSIRELYADPMTRESSWTLVYLTPTDMGGVQRLSSVARRILQGELEELNSENIDDKEPGLGNPTDSVFSIKDRQITGIRSKSDEEGLRVYQDSRIYSDWLFSALPKPEIGIEDLVRQLGPEDKP